MSGYIEGCKGSKTVEVERDGLAVAKQRDGWLSREMVPRREVVAMQRELM